MKRFLSLILAVALLIGALPASLAENTETAAPEIVEEFEEAEELEEIILEENIDFGDESGILLTDEDGTESTEEPTGSAVVLVYGDSGDEVLEMQQKLTDLGYYTGNLSGNFKEATRSALRSFQKDNGLEATGEATAETLTLLYNTDYRPLKYGSSGDDVKSLQKRLMELGYYTGKVSGNYLEATEKAIKAFQSKNSLEENGVADAATQELLFSAKALNKSDKVNTTPTPTPNVSFLVDEDAAEDVVAVSTENVAYEKTLKQGMSGPLVKTLQTRLTELGYYTGPISGNFLGKTNSAVKKLQTQNALEADGVVDEDLWNLIFNNPTIVLPQHTAKPTPEPTPVPFAITVDVNNQVTTVYGRDENGEYTIVVREMLCSTGMVGNDSDPGDWVLNGRKARWCYFPKWGSHAQYWTRINSSIAFHSVIYNSVNTMDLSVKSYKALGRRASHGCIRLSVADAKWIYDNVGAGTVVSIVENLPDDPELRASLKMPALNYSNMLPQTTPEPTASPVYVSGAQPPQPIKQMKKNDSGEDVYWLQCKLKELGYYNGKCSGTYLNGTVNAVKAFQRANKIYPDGIAGEKTLAILYAEEMKTPEPTAEPTPTPEATPAPTEIEIDFSEEAATDTDA